jgi:hypothetical protein
MNRFSPSIFILSTAFLLPLSAFAVCAWAHEDYPYDCCRDQHCHPVPCNEIHMEKGYYHWKQYSIPARQVRMDLPGCHVCIQNENMICIFVEGDS